MKRIYLDYSATTPIDERVKAAMLPYFTDNFANPSSMYEEGFKVRNDIVSAREKIAAHLNVIPDEIFFTSGGTESDNWAIIEGAQLTNRRTVITTSIEHAAVLEPCKRLKKLGFKFVEVNPDSEGIINPKDLESVCDDDTALVSVMAANNEIGTIQPILECAKIAHSKGALFHTDAVQAIGSLPINIKQCGIDMLTLSGHKIYAPKGIGLLYVRSGLNLPPYIMGGMQESGRRAGTTNAPLIIGLSTAMDIAFNEFDINTKKLRSLRDRFISGIESKISGVTLNGSRTNRLNQNANFSFDGCIASELAMRLDMAGIACSLGAACKAGSPEPSHVLTKITTPERANSALRFTFGKYTTEQDIDEAITRICRCVEKTRNHKIV